MLTLAIECSAAPASAALLDSENLLGEYFVNVKQTHSLTLMPMVQSLLKSCGKKISEVELFAVYNGPGSFTGVRIGVSCVKGMAMPNNTLCCPVSSLEVIAMGGRALKGHVLCAVMDARCKQVYNALFSTDGNKLTRLCDDRALSVDELYRECQSYGSKLVLFGDGAKLCYESFKEFDARLAPVEIRFQRAANVALLAGEKAKSGFCQSPAQLSVSYLRLPQAERELKKRREVGN